MTLPLEGRVAMVIGVERPAGRRAAVGLAEAGANVAVVTLSRATSAEFAANSTANEFWAIGRQGIALPTDGGAELRDAISEASVQLGPVSIVVCHSPAPLSHEALAGLRSDPAIVVLIGEDDAPAAARALLDWTRDLAARGLRANALIASRAAADVIGPSLKEHHAPEALTLSAAVVYLASDASAAIEGAVLVAES